MIIESGDSMLTSGSAYSSCDTERKHRIPQGAFDRERPYLLPFSAHDKATLKRNITAHGKIADQYDILDLSYTLANRRSRHPSRAFAVTSYNSLEDTFSNNTESFVLAEKKKTPSLGFAFTGQGAQWARMGSELLTYYPSFLKSIRVLDRVLKDLPDKPDWSLEDALLEDTRTSRINEAEFSQPLCTAIQVATVQLLAIWGIKPNVTVGHSSGEIAAAFAAGLISASEAITAAYYRGKVVSKVDANGAMMAVGLGAEELTPFLKDTNDAVVIACHNSPASVTLSGDKDALEIVKRSLDAENIFARLVKTGGKAYHSHHMEPVAAEYERLMQDAKALAPFTTHQSSDAIMVSSVTNSVITGGIDEKYWGRNLRSPVLFNQAVQTIATDSQLKSKVDLLIEVGPHSALSGPIRQICTANGFDKLGYLPTLLRGEDSAAQLLKLAGELFLRDYPLDLERVTLIENALPSGKIQHQKGSVIVDLPTYQWNYAKDFWAEVRQSREHRAPTHARHDILGATIPGGSLAEPTWRNILRIRDVPWLKDHVLGGEAVFPAAGYFSMAIEAITQLNESRPNPLQIDGYVLRDVSIKAALVTPDDDTGIEVIYNMRPSIYSEGSTQTEWWDFGVSSISEDGSRNDHITGSISLNTRQRGQIRKAVPNLPNRASGKSWNQQLREVGFDYGATFQDMADIRSDGKNFVAACKTMVKSESGVMDGESRYVLHPGSLDSCLQLIIVSIYAGRLNDMTCGAVPVQVDEVAIWVPTAEQLKHGSADAYSWTDQRGNRSFVCGSQLVSGNGELLMDITDIRCTAYEAAVPIKIEAPLKAQPYGEMIWKYDIDSLKAADDPWDAAQIVDLAVHKNPSLRVLNIGSTNTSAILAKSQFLNYTAAEKSDERIEEIRQLVQDYKNAQVLKLDYTLETGFSEIPDNSFDLVVSSVGPSPYSTLRSIHRMLVPGGRVMFGLESMDCVTTLQEAGFSDTKLFGSKNKHALVLATATKQAVNGMVNGFNHTAVLLYRKSPAGIVAKVEDAFHNDGWQTTSTALENYHGAAGEHVIMLADFEGPLLATLQESELAALQRIASTASSVLWITAGGLFSGKKPEYAMPSGLTRSITSEQNALDLITLDFDLETTSESETADIVVRSANRQTSKLETHESEYYVSGGRTYISRLVPNDSLNQTYAFDKNDAESVPFNSKMHLVGKVQSGKVIFEADERVGEPLAADYVEVRVTVSGLNKEDTLVISGSSSRTTFSHEFGGVIERIGSKVTGLAVGDKVAGFTFDRFSTHQRVRAEYVQKIKEDEDLNEIVSILMAYGAAIYGLQNLADLQPQETVLILQGTGLAGIAALKVAQMLNAKPYVAISTDAEAKRLETEFGLPQTQILRPSKYPITAQLDAATGRCGADVVFSSGFVDATVARECWRGIAPFGRFVNSERKNALQRSVLDTIPLHRGANYLSFDLVDLYTWKPQTLIAILKLTTSLYRQRLISPIEPVSTRNIANIDDAVATFTDNFASGKTLISYAPSPTPLSVVRSGAELKFRKDATYLLVGCLGGLGRSLTSWMMKKGAQRFAFLSRSGTDSEQAAILVEDIKAAGVAVQVIRGDVTDRADVERAVRDIPNEYPIRGVVQAAMVLKVCWSRSKFASQADQLQQDGLFHSMSYNSWLNSTRPKVQGTLNLHSVLQQIPLDFFVTTSSTSGTLGTPGQSNYAAGNAFLDALARHRRLHSQPCTSLILPMVLGVGYVAEHPEVEEALKRKGIYGIDEEHLLDSFEVAIATQASNSPTADHIVVGLDPSKLQKSLAEAATTDGFWMEDSRFKFLMHSIKSAGSDDASAASQSIASSIKSATTAADAIEMASKHFEEKLSRLLLIPLEEFEPDVKAIAEYGLDSMIGAELRIWIFKEFKLNVPFQQLLGPGLTITKFAKQVCENLGVVLE